MIHNFTRFKRILNFTLVIMAIIPLYQSTVFWNDALESIQILKGSLEAPATKVIYKTNRFDDKLKDAQSQSDAGNFEESNTSAVNYFDQAFVDGCDSLWLISQNYTSLWNNSLASAYKDAERFCELVRLPELESEMSELHKWIKKSTILYPDELVFSVFDLYFRSVLNGEELVVNNKFKDSLSHKFIQAVIKTKWSEYENYTFDDFSDILDVDFVPKPSILVTLWSRYNQEDILKQALEYEDIIRNRGQFRSVHHNVYYSLAASTNISNNDRLFYYLSLLEFNSSESEKYQDKMVFLFYTLELFKDQKNIDAFSVIFSKLDTELFNNLQALSSDSKDKFTDISKVIASHDDNIQYELIKEKPLLEYLYTIISEKDASEICDSLGEVKLLDLFSKVVDSFVICETKKQTLDDVEEVLDTVSVEDNTTPEETKKEIKKWESFLSKINLPGRENMIFILSLIIFISIVLFIAFIFVKKK